MRYLFLTLCSLFMFVILVPANALIKGKADVGAALLSIDVLESGKTIETLRMRGIRGDATVILLGGFFVKPSVTWAKGDDSRLSSYSLSGGHCYPLTDSLLLMPGVGATLTYLHTRVDIEEFKLVDLKEKFRSVSPFISVDLTYRLTEQLTLMGMYQYAWSTTHTSIASLFSDKSHSAGPNYGLGIDYRINSCFSIVAAVGYNITLSKEKHGLRGKGGKLSIGYHF